MSNDALPELLTEVCRFYALFGFLSRAGDRCAITPLLQLAVEADQATQEEVRWVVTGLTHRAGRAAFHEELDKTSTPNEEAGPTREVGAGRFFSLSAEAAQEYFALFHRCDGIEPSSILLPRETLH